MSNHKSRLQKLEKNSGRDMPEVVILTFNEGIVCNVHNSNPELIGKTEAYIDALFAARDDVQIIKIVYASQENTKWTR
jgi:hypothetical protein